MYSTRSKYGGLQTNKTQFSHALSKLAARYLSALASTVYSERLFSEAGNVYEESRLRLFEKIGEKLINFYTTTTSFEF